MASDMEGGSRPSAETLQRLGAFYRAWGYRAVVAGGAIWIPAGSFSLVSALTTVLPEIDDWAVRSLLRQTRRLAAVYGGSRPEGTTVPVYNLRDKSYDEKTLQRQFRQHVIKASKALEVRPCSWEEWVAAAVTCDRETLVRRGYAATADAPFLSAEGRRAIASLAASIPGLQIQACFSGTEIAAYLVHLTMGSVCEGLMIHRRDTLTDPGVQHASHLVYFAFARAAMARPDVLRVCVGRGSVPPNDPLASFKRHAGFSEEPYHLRFRLHPWMAPALESRLGARVLKGLRDNPLWRPPVLANLEVMERASLR